MVATPFSIREIGEADHADVASLLDAARTSSAQFRGSDVLESILAKANVSALPGRIAVVDGEVKGLVVWTIAEQMLTDKHNPAMLVGEFRLDAVLLFKGFLSISI